MEVEPIEIQMFRQLLTFISQEGYGLRHFYYLCNKHDQTVFSRRNLPDDEGRYLIPTLRKRTEKECKQIWDSFIRVAENMVDIGSRTPLEAIIWLVDTAFPMAGMFTTNTFLYTEEGRRQTNINVIKDEEKRRNQLFRTLKKVDQRLYDYYYRA